MIIRTLKTFGIDSHKDEEFTGVWVGEEKICAIGVKLSRWITMHGLAFNINNELSLFESIIPCGIFHKGVTSLKKLTGTETDIKSVTEIVIKNMESVFGIKTKKSMLADLPVNFGVV